jgi:Skp family chaperone for outer membrane proteins
MARMLVIALILTASVAADRAGAQDKGQPPANRILNIGIHFGFGPGILVNASARQEQASPVSKIAVVNVGKVFIEYEKAKHFKQVLQDQVKPYKDKMDSWHKEMTEYQDLLQKHDPRFSEEELQKRIADRKHALEDANLAVRKLIGKDSEEQLVALWKEIIATVKKHAESQGYVMVLGYGDPTDAKELHAFANINRKMHGMDSGGVTPLYAHPSCDITDGLIARLNHAYREQVRKTADRRK